jgi:hypothetical protein
MEVLPGISMDPDVRFGKPCLSGTRIDVATSSAPSQQARPLRQSLPGIP